MEYGKPLRYSLRGDAAVVRYGRNIENRANASCKKLDERGEESRVLDVEKLPYIALHVCVDIVGEERFSFHPPRQKPWIASGKDSGQMAVCRDNSTRLLQAERKKRVNSTSPGKGLRDTLHQKNVARSSEDEKSVSLLVIDNALNVGKQIWYALYLIKNRPVWEVGEKIAGVVVSIATRFRIFKRPVRFVRKQSPRKRRLPRLPRSKNRYDRVFCNGFFNRRFYESLDFHGVDCIKKHRFMQYGKLTLRIA